MFFHLKDVAIFSPPGPQLYIESHHPIVHSIALEILYNFAFEANANRPSIRIENDEKADIRNDFFHHQRPFSAIRGQTIAPINF